MKTIFSMIVAALLSVAALGQDQSVAAGQDYGTYKIVFQLSTGDTLAHKALMKQIGNITSVAPQTQIEVVCHGPGLAMLQTQRSVVGGKVTEFAGKGVSFVACEFSMKERNVSKEEMLPSAGYVKAGILHIVGRQADDWYYIKSGF